MKQITIITLMFLCIPFTSKAQVYKHSLGLRMNSHYPLYNPSLSYQLGLNKKNRLDFNISARINKMDMFSYTAINASIYHQHVMNIKGGLNWFLGAGVSYQYQKRISPNFTSTYNSLEIGPTIGLEYDFNKHNVPLILSLDFRPSLGYNFNSGKSNFGFNQKIGLSLHYTFKEKKKETIRNSMIE